MLLHTAPNCFPEISEYSHSIIIVTCEPQNVYLKMRKSFSLLLIIPLLSASLLFAQPQTQLWYQHPGSNLGAVMGIVVDGEGRIFASSYQQGIFRSVDTGKTWQQIAPFTDGVWTMAVQSSGEIVASLWSRGMYRSTDHGTTWTAFTNSRAHADIRAVNNTGHLFIESAGKLYRTSVNDTAWMELPIGGGAVAVSGNTVIAAKGTSCYLSTDNGVQWLTLASAPSTIYSIAALPNGSLFAGTYFDPDKPSASLLSYHAGSNMWTGNGPPSTINAIVQRQDGVLFAASHDSGFYTSKNNGSEWRRINHGLSTTKIFSLAVLSDTMIVAGTLDGVFITKNLSQILSINPDIVSGTGTVTNFTLRQNFPNPFNPTSTISYSIFTQGHVVLAVTDLLGREIAVLVDELQQPGSYSVRYDARGISSGIYLYTLRSGAYSITRKMLLLR
jgi:hypothetical protein